MNIVVVQLLNCVSFFAIPWTAAHQVSLSSTISWTLLKFMFIELVMSSNITSFCHPLLLQPSIFPKIRVFSNESPLRIRWLNYWCFSLSISVSNECSGLIFHRIDWFGFLSVQGTLKSLLLTITTIWKHQCFGTQPSLWSNSHIQAWPVEKP